MVPGPSTDTPLPPALADQLVGVAWRAIRAGLDGGPRLTVRAADYPDALRAHRATFVTLRRHGELRGCIGAIVAHRPLVEDVAHNACAAAFSDPRFPPLERHELDGLDLHLSILSPMEPLTYRSEADLVRQIRPGVDGLLLEDGRHVGTLLPSVWESLPDPEAFWRALKRKAGLPADYWSPTLRVCRYTAASVP
jgi:AmmeMemoRadiSam system protein A